MGDVGMRAEAPVAHADGVAVVFNRAHRAIGQLPEDRRIGVGVVNQKHVRVESDEPHMGKMLDMMMMLVPGGEERTAREYAALLEPNGFRVTRVLPTSSPPNSAPTRLGV